MKIKTAISVCALSAICFAETISLQPGKSISEAIVKVRPGDTISLAPGIYKENIVIRDRITIMGASAKTTIIRGDGRSTVVTMHGKASIENLTISGGQIGVQSQSANAKISNCVISENRGSGLLAIRTIPEINQVIFASNGGNGIQAVEIAGGSLLLDSLTFADNGGSGISYDGSQPLSITHSLFFQNRFKAILDPGGQIVASQNLIYPEQKEYASNNRTGKPEFVITKETRYLYIHAPESPGRGTGANIR